ncbi:MAG: hypothetical protein J6U64_05595 [Alphaproteobacteria bacterium]|nr:hypothetical protein [Alphaproteobacteria bacterium]
MVVSALKSVRVVMSVMKQRVFVKRVVRLNRNVVAVPVLRNVTMPTVLTVKTGRVVMAVVRGISVAVSTVFLRIAVSTEKNILGMKLPVSVRQSAVQRNMYLRRRAVVRERRLTNKLRIVVPVLFIRWQLRYAVMIRS